MLQTVRTVIVDEIHAVAPNKRGAHLALSLERLEALTFRTPPTHRACRRRNDRSNSWHSFLRVIGRRPRLSTWGTAGSWISPSRCRRTNSAPIATNAIWADVYDRLAELVREHRSTLVFVNTRRLVERVSHYLEERLKTWGLKPSRRITAASRGRSASPLKSDSRPARRAWSLRRLRWSLGIDVGHR